MMGGHTGEALSLIAAVLWALALVLFRRSGEHVHPIALNTFKNIMALVLYVPTMYVAGESLFRFAPLSDYALLVGSGAIGLAVGDTLLFYSLNRIGASAYALVACMYSPVIIALSFLFIGERLTWLQLVGAILIVASVLEATRTAPGIQEATRERRDRFIGIGIGLLGVVAMGVGVVMIKPLLSSTPLFWAVEVRLAGGVVALLILLALHPARQRIVRSLMVKSHTGVTVTASFIGGYMAMVCWLGGIQFAQASVAAALNQTYSVFTLVFAALILRERITVTRVIAILLALTGAALVTFG